MTSKTVIEKETTSTVFFSDLEGLADTSTRVLSDNEHNLIQVGQVTEPVLRLLTIYSPEFPCLIKGAAALRAGRLNEIFEGNQVKQYIEFGDRPVPRPTTRDDRRRTARSATARGATACRTRRSRSPGPVDFNERHRARDSPSGGNSESSTDAATPRPRAPASSSAIFVARQLIVTGTLAAIMGNFGFGSETEYKADFTTASLLEKGDDVRVAGVSVGEVKKVEIKDRDTALVTFRVKSDVPVTTTSRAEIRFLNLVGDRYLALEAGRPTGRRRGSPSGGTHPGLADHARRSTSPSCSTASSRCSRRSTPSRSTSCSMNLVQVLQGEGGTIQELLANTASLTNSLADRDQLIGQVVNNLTPTLDTVDQPAPGAQHARRRSCKDWMADLARDRNTIGGSLDNVSDLTVVVADLLREGRPLRQERRRQARRSWPSCSTSRRTSSSSTSCSTGCPSR